MKKNPGYKHFYIKPEFIADLTWVESSYESVYGTIVSNWKREGKTITHNVVVPANSEASYIVAAKNKSAVRINGKSLSESSISVGSVNDRLLIKLPSGKYVIEIGG